MENNLQPSDRGSLLEHDEQGEFCETLYNRSSLYKIINQAIHTHSDRCKGSYT